MLRFLPPPRAPALPDAPLASGAAPAATAVLSPAEQVSRWAVASGDAGRRPFVIVDKPLARVMVFDASGRLQHSAPALLGLARGDDSVPGIGTRPMAKIKPEERITPAGRFVARRGVNLSGEDIVWVDYDAAVSMHRIRPVKASERRLERLASETIDDNRISYGCINLPPAFYEQALRPVVDAGPTVVYVLPDTRPLAEVFALGGKAPPPRHAAL
ncbi:MAG: L,D-transpeptidase [Rhizobacter sp.]|nr:L,D-transpeptidase [Rhizobacter sp.]